MRIATFRLVNFLFLGFAYRAHYRKTQFAGCQYWSGPEDTDLELWCQRSHSLLWWRRDLLLVERSVYRRTLPAQDRKVLGGHISSGFFLSGPRAPTRSLEELVTPGGEGS